MYVKKAGATSQTIEVFIQDSSKTDGSGLAGLAYNTASLVASYVRPVAARAAISLATQTTTGAWSSGGFVEIDSSNMPGWYRLDVPDAALAAGVDHVGICLKGATNMAPCNLVILLWVVDVQDGVRAALTALPNAAAEASGGLYTRGSGAGQINQTVNGLANANLIDIAGSAVSTSAAQLGVNAVNIGGQAAALDANNMLKVDIEDIAGAAVSTSTAQLGVNAVTVADKTGYGLAATGLDSVVMSDIAAVPGITASIKTALNWIFCLHRNKRIQTATTETVYKDDASTPLATSAKSDDGSTFTRGEYS